MSKRKIAVCCLGAIAILIISQVAAQFVGSLFVIIHIPEFICNIIAGAAYLCLAYLLIKLFAEKIIKKDLASLGIPQFHIDIKWLIAAFALPCMIIIIYLLLPGTFISSEMDSRQILTVLGAGIAFTGLAAGFVEEMVFRGIILNILKDKWNTKTAVLVPSLLFGLVHIIGMDFSLVSCLLVLVAGTMAGIMFSLIELESNSIWNSGIVHSLWNIMIIGGGLSIVETMDTYAIITYVPESKNFLLTGGEFGIEASVIAVAGYAIVSLAAFLLIKKKKATMIAGIEYQSPQSGRLSPDKTNESRIRHS